MLPRIEALAMAVVCAGFGVFLVVDPPVLGGFLVAAGAEMLVLGRFLTPSTPVAR